MNTFASAALLALLTAPVALAAAHATPADTHSNAILSDENADFGASRLTDGVVLDLTAAALPRVSVPDTGFVGLVNDGAVVFGEVDLAFADVPLFARNLDAHGRAVLSEENANRSLSAFTD